MENLERRMHMSEIVYDAVLQTEGKSHHYIHSCKVQASRTVTTDELETAFRAIIHFQVNLFGIACVVPVCIFRSVA